MVRAAAFLLLALLAAPATAQLGPSVGPYPVDLGINVVMARDLGCSDDSDWWTVAADLRVTVFLEGATFLQTAKAQDVEQPTFALGATARQVTAPVSLTIMVEEAEPNGWFGTNWVDCDVAPGSPTRYTFLWTGEQMDIVTRGDDPGSAEARVVVGAGMPSAPSIDHVDPGTESARIQWHSTLPSGASVQSGMGRFSAFDQAVDATSPNHTVGGLQDATQYEVRLAVRQGPWVVANEVVPFETLNAPPPPFSIREVRRAGSDTLEASLAGSIPHDAQRWEFHAGDAPGFSIGPGSYRSTGAQRSDEMGMFATPWDGFYTVPVHAGDAYLRVVTYDFGGLSSPSGSVAIPPSAAPASSSASVSFSSSSTSTSSQSASTSATGSQFASTSSTGSQSTSRTRSQSAGNQDAAGGPAASNSPAGTPESQSGQSVSNPLPPSMTASSATSTSVSPSSSAFPTNDVPADRGTIHVDQPATDVPGLGWIAVAAGLAAVALSHRRKLRR